MTEDSAPMEWSVAPIDPILLNALVDARREDVTALADDQSRALVTEAYEAVVDEETKDAFEDVAETVQSESDQIQTEGHEIIETVVSRVREALAEEGVVAHVNHENVLSLGTNQAIVYTFSRTRDPAPLDGLDVSEDVLDSIRDASPSISDEKWEQAAAELETAVAEALTISEEVVTRTLAALCYHWGGADQRTIDLVGEAVSLDSNTWLPWLPGYSADADPAYATTDEFRAGKYGVTAFLRYIANVPGQASVTPYVGYSEDGHVEWEPLNGSESCMPLERLDEETYVRFEIEGPVDAFPAFQAYYIGLGIIDLEVNEIRDVLDVLEDGPTGERVTETARFEKATE